VFEVILNQLGGQVTGGGLGPGAEGDAGGLVVADLRRRPPYHPAGLDGLAEAAEAVQRQGDVPLGRVGFPAVAGAVEEGDGPGAVVDALLVPGAGVEHRPDEVERLALTPEVAEVGADAKGFLAVGPASGEPRDHGHDRGVL
jgi:hypothetical protein